MKHRRILASALFAAILSIVGTAFAQQEVDPTPYPLSPTEQAPARHPVVTQKKQASTKHAPPSAARKPKQQAANSKQNHATIKTVSKRQ